MDTCGNTRIIYLASLLRIFSQEKQNGGLFYGFLKKNCFTFYWLKKKMADFHGFSIF